MFYLNCSYIQIRIIVNMSGMLTVIIIEPDKDVKYTKFGKNNKKRFEQL
jgi:hypothetical protein